MGRNPKKSQNHAEWLQDILPLHQRLSASVESLLESMLKKKNIEYLSVTSRVKSLDGAIEKISRKEYRNPSEQLTDLSGIRVITYLEQQVGQITAIIKDLFEVDENNSLDRTQTLGDDKVGYRSTHFVCALGSKRGELPEYEALGTLKFEVQVRTVLQHAWAELAHDRSFKFGTALPRKIQRKLNLHSGLLEIVDSAFDEISKEIDTYKRAVEKKTIPQLAASELDSISVAKLLNGIARRHSLKLTGRLQPANILELLRFGISNIGELQALISQDFISRYKKHIIDEDFDRHFFLRRLMLYADIDRPFILGLGWNLLTRGTFNLLVDKYGRERVDKLFKKYKLEFLDVRMKLDAENFRRRLKATGKKDRLSRPRSAKPAVTKLKRDAPKI